jgi:hypothetical protein
VLKRISMKLSRTGIRIGSVAALATGLVFETSATSLGFANLETVANDYANQLSVTIADGGGGTVLFTFANSGPIAGRIKGVSIQDLGSLLTNPVIVDSPSSVDFESGVGANIPNSISFVEDFDFKVNGAAARGVDPGEILGLRFSAPLAGVLEDIASGDIRFGLHVGSIAPNGGSQKFLSDPPTSVPDAGATLGLLSAGLAGLVAFQRRCGRR